MRKRPPQSSLNGPTTPRALSEKPETVAKLGQVIIDELQKAGVAACGKHFPGHGDTGTDSHLELPIVEHAPDRLRAVEFVPFKAAIEAGVAFIMTAHVLVTSIDDERPATLSSKIVRALLREELGFNGVIVSDDLEMKAIVDSYEPGDAAVAAVAAGCDALLMCGSGKPANIELQAQALEALIHAVEDDRLPIKRVEDALERNRRAKERFVRDWRPPTAAQLRTTIGSEQHRAISEQMAEFA